MATTIFSWSVAKPRPFPFNYGCAFYVCIRYSLFIHSSIIFDISNSSVNMISFIVLWSCYDVGYIDHLSPS